MGVGGKVQVIPAIDLKDGRVVRLLQGRASDVTVYSQDPVAVAQEFEQQGARRLHVVDLDGAFTGKPKNMDLVREVVKHVKMSVELGGGIRDLATVERVLDLGVQWAILGTVAQRDPDFVAAACRKFPGRILVGIDAKNGMVAVEGWVETTEVSAVELAKRMYDVGVAEIIFTDVAVDGMLSGPNLAAIEQLLGLGPKIIASGGISGIGDLVKLAELAPRGVSGAIIGKALYSGQFTVAEAIAVVQEAMARGQDAAYSDAKGVKQ